MNEDFSPLANLVNLLVRVRQEGTGLCTAQVVGLPEIQATAATREEALAEVRRVVAGWLSSGQLVPLTLPSLPPMRKSPGWARGDRLEEEFLEDLARLRQEDRERTLREYEQEERGLSATSSIATTCSITSPPR
jgi:hypothetical protein